MFTTLRNAWKVPDLRKKMLYTLLMLLIYRLGAHIPTPGVNADFIKAALTTNTLGQFYDLFSGGALSNATLFALGITPYITGQIIMQLLTMAIPALERMQKEGPEGRKKIASITRYVGVGLGLVQAISTLMLLLNSQTATTGALMENTGAPMILNYITVVLCLTAGTALIIWIGERITENGVGNGISLLIFISIISRLPNAIQEMILNKTSIWVGIVIVVLAVLVVTGITFIDMSERRIPVQYAKRVIGRKIYSGQSTHIPMKINQSGVLPLIFAVTLLQFPQMIIQFFGDSSGYEKVMGSQKPLYLVIYALLIFFFTFFYSQVTFNTPDVAKNIQQNGGFIPGIRAGKPTSDYLQKILMRVTLFGAIFLAVVATVQMYLQRC
jgi:preprotein translocase subunit SecY